MNLQKSTPYRNRKILDFARDQPCTLCGRNDGTTVAAHYSGIYSSLLGKGLGEKAWDHVTFVCCSTCHKRIDEYSGGNHHERAIEIMLAIFETQRRWLTAGVLK